MKHLSRLTQTLQVTASILVSALHDCHIDSPSDSGSLPAVFALCRFTPTSSCRERPGRQEVETEEETLLQDVQRGVFRMMLYVYFTAIGC